MDKDPSYIIKNSIDTIKKTKHEQTKNLAYENINQAIENAMNAKRLGVDVLCTHMLTFVKLVRGTLSNEDKKTLFNGKLMSAADWFDQQIDLSAAFNPDSRCIGLVESLRPLIPPPTIKEGIKKFLGRSNDRPERSEALLIGPNNVNSNSRSGGEDSRDQDVSRIKTTTEPQSPTNPAGSN